MTVRAEGLDGSPGRALPAGSGVCLALWAGRPAPLCAGLSLPAGRLWASFPATLTLLLASHRPVWVHFRQISTLLFIYFIFCSFFFFNLYC